MPLLSSSKILIPAAALEIQSLSEYPADEPTPAARGFLAGLTSTIGRALGRNAAPPAAPAGRFDADPTYIALALQTAFANVDSELINAPLKLLAANVDAKARESKILPDLSQHPMGLATMLPAMSGTPGQNCRCGDSS